MSVVMFSLFIQLNVSWSLNLFTHTCTVTLTSSADILCPGDTVVFTCVTDTGRLVWEINNITGRHSFHSPAQINMPITVKNFTLTLLSVTNNSIYQSTAVAHNVSVDYNGTKVSCRDGSVLNPYHEQLRIIIGKMSDLKFLLFCIIIFRYSISTIATSQLDCCCEFGQLICDHQLGRFTGHTPLCTQLHCHC